jgi:hypothetical protein
MLHSDKEVTFTCYSMNRFQFFEQRKEIGINRWTYYLR